MTDLLKEESRPRGEWDLLPARATSAPTTASTEADVHGTRSYRELAEDIAEVEALAAFSPSCRRRGVLLVVECVWCSTPAVKSIHAHRAGSFEPIVREAGCRRGSYRITVTRRTWSR